MTEYLDSYKNFVDVLTSEPSKNKDAFINRINELYADGCDVSRLLTGSVGLCAEAGELLEVVKKILFQGKPYNADNVFHMKRELGDIMFYVMNACIAIGEDPVEIIDENVRKLEARYPGGKFNIHNSEVRKEGDL